MIRVVSKLLWDAECYNIDSETLKKVVIPRLHFYDPLPPLKDVRIWGENLLPKSYKPLFDKTKNEKFK